MSEWQPIETAPYRDLLDVWCIYGDEELATYPSGQVTGYLQIRRFKSVEYGWFGNQSAEGVPQKDGPDLIPVAWRHATPDCPAELVQKFIDGKHVRTPIPEPKLQHYTPGEDK